MHLYQILNYQYQPVKEFETLQEAKDHIAFLNKTYKETFYVVELNVVYKAVSN